MERGLYNQDTIFRGGGWRVQKEATSFLWYGGSCSSKILLTVSLKLLTINQNRLKKKDASVIDFYRLIDTIDINQINSNDLYRFID